MVTTIELCDAAAISGASLAALIPTPLAVMVELELATSTEMLPLALFNANIPLIGFVIVVEVEVALTFPL